MTRHLRGITAAAGRSANGLEDLGDKLKRAADAWAGFRVAWHRPVVTSTPDSVTRDKGNYDNQEAGQ